MRTGLAILALSVACTQSHAGEIREYILGDVDGFHYDGAGSVDDVYVAPALVADSENPTWPLIPFDTFGPNSLLPFTFRYPLLAEEAITSATLTVAMRASDSLASTDRVFLLSEDASYAVDWYFDVIAWLPISGTETTIRSLQIENIQGADYLWLMQDGVLNVRIQDDTAIDYATLSITVIPEPATLALLALGGMVILRRRRR